MFSFKKKDSKHSSVSEEASDKERLFFHDIINHTHGLLLYLSHKIENKKGLSGEELLDLRKEIKTLQSLLRDQYAFKHKNLVLSFEWVTFSQAYQAVTSLFSTYFSECDVKMNCFFKGDIDPNLSMEIREKGLIYFPVFYRIMNNLIKNMAEAKTKMIELHFEMNDSVLYIETKNSMNNRSKDLTEHLSRAILDESVSSIESLGLLSVEHLTKENGGVFSFEIKNQIWHNHVHLPVKRNLLSSNCSSADKKIPA